MASRTNLRRMLPEPVLESDDTPKHEVLNGRVPQGKIFRIKALALARLRWSDDDWIIFAEKIRRVKI